MNRKKIKKAAKILLVLGIGAAAFGLGFAWLVNRHIVKKTEARVFKDAKKTPKRYVAIVLGARVMPSGNPSPALADRLHAALDLYRAGRVKKILVTGDHGRDGYNEVESMYKWLNKRGVPANKIFVDHAGFRTFDSMIRAAKIFKIEDAVVCTQEFHLSRSVYLAQSVGIDAVGLIADRRLYAKRRKDARREFIARTVAFMDLHVWNRQPRHLGEEIPITGTPDASYDESLRKFLKRTKDSKKSS